MGLDVGKVTIQYLPRPAGLATEFAWQLATEASCSGDGNAFGFYRRDELKEKAKEFAKDNPLLEAILELEDWIAALPWDEAGYLVLTFNW